MATRENGRRRRQLSVAELTHVWEQVEGGTEADDRASRHLWEGNPDRGSPTCKLRENKE